MQTVESVLQGIAPVTPVGFRRSVAETLPEAVRRIVDALQPEKVVLFGSYAIGKATPDSDVDLLVVMETPASPTERHLSVARVLRPRAFPVDILVKTPAEMDRALNSDDFFMREIISQGLVLYERH